MKTIKRATVLSMVLGAMLAFSAPQPARAAYPAVVHPYVSATAVYVRRPLRPFFRRPVVVVRRPLYYGPVVRPIRPFPVFIPPVVRAPIVTYGLIYP